MLITPIVHLGMGFFLLGGKNGNLGFSYDGINWTEITTAGFGSNDVGGTDTGGGVLAAAGENGKIASTSLELINTGTSSSGYPFIMLDVLSDGNQVPDTTQIKKSAGLTGQYDNRIIFRRLGQHREFTPRLTISAPFKRLIFDVTARISLDG